MTYLIAILVAALVFFSFLLVTVYEGERGRRFFASYRYRLDQKVGRALFVIEHVDWGAFTAHFTRTAFTTIAHDIAHGSLVAVRATERSLTRAVRLLRSRRDDAALPAHGQKGPGANAQVPEAASGSPVAVAPEPVVAAETVIDAQSVIVARPGAGEGTPSDERRRKTFDIRPPSKRK